MRYKFHPDALTEYREATRWYANRQRPVAEKFITAIETDYILIVAVMHCSREPGYWKDRTATLD